MVRYGEMAHLGEGGAEFGVVDESANHLLARGDIGEVAWRGAQPPAEGALAKRGRAPATCHQRMCMWVVRRACHVSPREVWARRACHVAPREVMEGGHSLIEDGEEGAFACVVR